MLTVPSRVSASDWITEIGIGTSWEDSSRLREVTMTSLRPSPPPASSAFAESAAGAAESAGLATPANAQPSAPAPSTAAPQIIQRRSRGAARCGHFEVIDALFNN